MLSCFENKMSEFTGLSCGIQSTDIRMTELYKKVIELQRYVILSQVSYLKKKLLAKVIIIRVFISTTELNIFVTYIIS